MSDAFFKKVEGRTYAAPQYGKEITLKVTEDTERDAIAAISKEAMAELGVSEGDTIEIIGAWTQKVTVTTLREGEIDTIRLSESIRKALPISVGQEVGVRKEYNPE